MKSGKNRRPGESSETNRFLDFINGSVGAIMFFNLRSGVTQLISLVNFIGSPGNNVFKAAKHFANQPQYWGNVVKLLNSDFLVDRRGGAKFDISADEVSSLAGGKNPRQRLIANLLNKGFTPTRIADSLAIALGGATWYQSMKDAGLKDADIMLKFQELAEEQQQSSRPDRISNIQASPMGRIIFAFANTPLQYSRLTKKAFLDLANNRGNARNNLAKIAWYGGVQAAVFTFIQSALFAGMIGGEDDEEEEKQGEKNALWAAKNYVASWLKGWGLPGAIAGQIFSVAKAAEEGKRGSDLALEAVNISPPIGAKLRSVKQAWDKLKGTTMDDLKNIYKRNNETLEGIGKAASVANVPLDRMIYIMNGMRDAFADDLTAMQRLALAFGGFSAYQLGVEDKVKDEISEDSFSDVEFDEDEFEDVEFDDDDFEDVPFNRNADGMAHRDGTIEVDPNLSPLEREKTIKHEQEHVRQMEEEGLDYDDSNVYYKGKRHKRKDGKIRYANKWVPEGDPRLPWEAKAFAVE